MHEDTERCIRAVQSKDARFDGWFFTAVLTTGIYCRPSCPVVPPKPQNMRFFPSAAAAQQAGFRACKRCRPDASPGSPEWNERADLVARAMRFISDGVVDRAGVAGLAAQLGYSVRQVERQLLAELGAGPAVGRQGAVRQVAGKPWGSSLASISLRLPFRQPMYPDNLFGHLAATAIPGVEEWRAGAYRRTLRLPNGPGVVSLRPGPEYIACPLALTDLRDLAMAISRCPRPPHLDA